MTTPTPAPPHVSFADIEAAAGRIADHVHRTPIATSATFDAEVGASVFFKCENLQKVGAFKARGALNAVLSLTDEEAKRGVVAHSSGNHGAALAYAASRRGIPCTVVMPDHAPRLKIEAVRGYGAEVVIGPHAEREELTERIRTERDAILVHPYDDARVIAGQGTAARELIEDVADLDMVVAPVGGGGLLSGTAVSTLAMRPGAIVVGAEPAAADDAYRSLESGIRQPAVPEPDTIADGLLTGLGTLTFDILEAAGARIVLVSEQAIVEAALFHLQRMKLLVEPSGATPLAALRALAEEVAGLRVGVIVSGGNTDLRWLPDAT